MTIEEALAWAEAQGEVATSPTGPVTKHYIEVVGSLSFC
jgi:hypothetical protein